MDQVTAAVQPFIPDHAQQFAQHLHGFLASNLSVAGYDRLVFGETAGQSHAQAQSSGTSSKKKMCKYTYYVEDCTRTCSSRKKHAQHKYSRGYAGTATADGNRITASRQHSMACVDFVSNRSCSKMCHGISCLDSGDWTHAYHSQPSFCCQV